jgi:hypothetical protein
VRLERVAAIVLTEAQWEAVLAHAYRKLEERYEPGETREQQAFGLLAGRLDDGRLVTTRVVPLRRNLRGDPRHGSAVDAVVHELATPSRTPLGQRGWLADPRELLAAHARCDAEGTLVFASYHMHRIPWSHDPLRDTPTPLDTALSADQGLWMLIVSMVDPARPRVRAFWEGCREREAQVIVR